MVKVFILTVFTLISLGRRRSVGFAVSSSRGTIAAEGETSGRRNRHSVV